MFFKESDPPSLHCAPPMLIRHFRAPESLLCLIVEINLVPSPLEIATRQFCSAEIVANLLGFLFNV